MKSDNPDQLAGRDLRAAPRVVLDNGELTIKFFTLAHLLQRYATNISNEGMYIETKETLPEGSRFHFIIEIAEDNQSIDAIVEVAWRQRADDHLHKAGMGVKFVYLDEAGKELVNRIVAVQNGEG